MENNNADCTDDKKDDEDNKNNTPKIPPKRTILGLSLAYTLVFTAFEAIQNLQSSINEDGNLGVLSLALLYGFVLISAPLSPFLLGLFGIKNFLMTTWVAMALYCGVSFYPSLGTLIPASILCGFTMGTNGIVQGIYITAASKSYISFKQLNKTRLHSIISLFSGIFFMSFKSSQIIGNFISSFIFFSSTFNKTSLSENQCGAEVCNSLSGNSSIVIETPDDDVVYILLGVFLGCIVAGLLITIFVLPPLAMTDEKEEDEDLSLNSSREETMKTRTLASRLKKVFIFTEMFKTKFVLLMPLFVAQAMSVMVIYTGYTQAFVSCSAGIQWIGYTMMAFGFASSTVAISINYMARYINRFFLMSAFIVVDIGILITLLVWHPDQDTDIHLFFIIPALAGFSIGTSQPQFNALISTVFKGQEPQAFATLHFSRGVGFCLSLAMSSVACLYHRLYVTLTLYGLGFLGYVVLEWREKRQAKGKILEDDEGKT